MLKITKKQTAVSLGVTPCTVRHWETGQTQPPIEHIPAVLKLLGYDPFPVPERISDRLLAKRRVMGRSIREAAADLGVDPGTWADWERGKTILFRAHRALVARLLDIPEPEVDQTMARSWGRSHK